MSPFACFPSKILFMGWSEMPVSPSTKKRGAYAWKWKSDKIDQMIKRLVHREKSYNNIYFLFMSVLIYTGGLPCFTQFAVHVEGYIVKELPQHTVAKAIVMQVHSPMVQVDWDVVLPCKSGRELVSVWALIHINTCKCYPDLSLSTDA